MLQDAINRAISREDLSREEAAAAMEALMSGEATPAMISAFLIALRMKGESVDEITGLAETMRRFATKVTTRRHPLVDTCGTGGDHAGTFNISTTAAFVVAGAGVAVAKHGNRSASSRCGSADVLEELGVNINASPEVVGNCIDEVGIGFLFARAHHPAMKHVAPVRAEIRARTVFNVLGPLTNPASADGQVVGVFDQDLVEPLAKVLQQLGARHAFVVAGEDGLDEITTCGASLVAEAVGGNVTAFTVSPEEYGIPRTTREAISGGDARDNAQIIRNILAGELGPKRDIVVMNAAPALVAGMAAATFEEGIRLAQHSIDSGTALRKLEELVICSHKI